MTQKRPQSSDYAPNFGMYISLVPGGDLAEILETQLRDSKRLWEPLTETQAELRYAPGKWSMKEILGHLTDAERVFAYRLLRIARGDQTPLPGFEQDDYVKTANSSARKFCGLLEEFAAVRRATILLIRSLDDTAWSHRGTASQKEISALALACIISGHELHHRRIFEQHYLPAMPRS